MNLKEIAESDLAEIMESPNGIGNPFTLIDTKGNSFDVMGTFGDIGYMLDNETGLPVKGRTITATYRMKTLSEKTNGVPCEGWKVKAKDLNGKENTFFVVGYEPDRTIGIGRIKMGNK